MNEPIVNGIYQHYKGHHYVVIALAIHSETLEPLVVYQALYDNKQIWVRPLSMWNDIVTNKDGKRVKRIEYKAMKR